MCWSRLVQKAWASFHANVRAPSWRKLGKRRRLTLLDRCVTPVVRHYLAVIPPQHSYCEKLNRMQRRMVSAAIGNTRWRTEDWPGFVRRSAREASTWIENNTKWWSREWMHRSILWADHLVRDHAQQLLHFEHGVQADLLSTRWSWAAALYSYHANEWLSNRRVYRTRSRWLGTLYSMTGTRAIRGRVHIRYHDGVAHARRMSA